MTSGSNARQAARSAKALLPIRTAPVPGEHAIGFVLRLAELNAYPSPTWLPGYLPPKEQANYTRRKTGASRSDLVRNVLQLTGTEADMWQIGGFVDNNTKLYCLGQGRQAAKKSFQLARPKVCPKCLADRPVLLAAWDAVYWVACPIHECTMTAECPVCHRPLSWSRTRLDRCCPDAPLAAVEPCQAPKPVVALSRLFARAIGFQAPAPPKQMLCLLGHLDLAQLTLVVSRIPLLGARHMQGMRGSRGNELNLQQAIQQAGAAAEFLAGFPRTLHELLEQNVLEQQPASLLKEFAKRFPTLRHRPKDDPARFITDELDRHIKERHPAYTFFTPGVSTVDGTGSMMSASAAARALNLAVATLHREVAAGRIPAQRFTRGKHASWMFDRAQVEELARRMAEGESRSAVALVGGAMGVAEAGKLLGLTEGPAKTLLAAGILRRASGVGYHRYKVDSSSVRELLTALSQVAIEDRDHPDPIQAPKGGDQFDIPALSERMRTSTLVS